MSLSDPIANMLTSIRNANMRGYDQTEVPASKVKIGMLEVLKKEGFICDFQIVDCKPQNSIKITLKYGEEKERVITQIKRVSKPGCRMYATKDQLRPVRNGFGIDIVSTSQGIISDKECRQKAVGGEILATVF